MRNIIKPDFGGWGENATADNGTATATKSAETGRRHIVTTILASYDIAGTSGKVLITDIDGVGNVFEVQIHDFANITLFPGLEMTVGGGARVTLTASGTAGNIGRLGLHGYTVD